MRSLEPRALHHPLVHAAACDLNTSGGMLSNLCQLINASVPSRRLDRDPGPVATCRNILLTACCGMSTRALGLWLEDFGIIREARPNASSSATCQAIAAHAPLSPWLTSLSRTRNRLQGSRRSHSQLECCRM